MAKILITGGHLTPALATIDYLQKFYPEVEIVFVGRQWAREGDRQLASEASAMNERGVKFVPFVAQKTGSFNIFTYGQTVKQAELILQAHQVTHVLTFGGYLGLPLALAGKHLGIPVVTHEQTRVLGRANRLISLLAQVTALSFGQTQKPWWVRRTSVTGNPLREQLWDAQVERPEWLPESNKPILYVAGGSQGSRTINENFLPLLERLAPDFTIVHQVGRASNRYRPQQEIGQYLLENHLIFPDYCVREFLSVEELAYLYPRIKLAVSRAGANTVAELTAFRIPTLYIPLPFANYQEQWKNAQALVEKDAAMMLEQKDLIPAELLAQIYALEKNATHLRDNLQKIPHDQQAAARLVDLVLTQKIIPKTKAPAAVPLVKNEAKVATASEEKTEAPPARGKSRIKTE
ncbi:glycosyltransferase [bacterium]|nr:glycosyltransferase [bacterium]MBQ6436226.1 glycosyltransferase [bacterium]